MSGSTRRLTVPWDSDRLEPQSQRGATHTADTPKNTDAHFLFFFFSSSFVEKRGQARTHAAAVHYSSWVQGGYVCLEHLYPSLAPSLRDYIMSHTTSTQFISLRLSALHLGTHHTTRCLPARILCKTTCVAWKKGFKYEFCVQCACDGGSVCWGLFVLRSWALQSTDRIDGNSASIFILRHYALKNLWTWIVPWTCFFLPADMLPDFIVLKIKLFIKFDLRELW